MAVALIAEEYEPVEDPLEMVADAPPPAPLYPSRRRAPAVQEPAPAPPTPMGEVMLLSLQATASLLTIRIMLLLAVIGAVAVAGCVGVWRPSVIGVITLVLYNLTVIGPLVWLARGKN